MAILHVQSKGAIATSLAYDSGNVAGNLLICVSGSGANISGVTDTQGNTWARAIGLDNGGALLFADIWYAKNCAAGANTVSLAGTFGGGFDGLAIAEYSGIDTASPLDQTNAATGNTGFGEQPNSGNITTTQADELLIGAVAADNGSGITWTGSFTERYDGIGGNRNPSLGDRIVTATGTYAATATGLSAASVVWQCLVASFKAAAGGGTAVPVFTHHYRQQGIA